MPNKLVFALPTGWTYANQDVTGFDCAYSQRPQDRGRGDCHRSWVTADGPVRNGSEEQLYQRREFKENKLNKVKHKPLKYKMFFQQ